VIKKIDDQIFKNLLNGIQSQILLEDNDIHNKDIIELQNNVTKEKVIIEITSKAKFNSVKECFKLIPYKLFGNFETEKDALEYYKYLDNNNVYAYRIKLNKDISKDIIKDDVLAKMLDLSSIKRNSIGFSACDVITLKLKNGQDAILKIQSLPNRTDLSEEYKRLKWLSGKINSPKVYYFNEK
jgi:hypothetical protein